MSQYTRFTMNLQGAIARRETLEGKEYLVVPTVMMTPGVHNGNQGPLLYVDEEMGKTPDVWNYKPVTLYHPTIDGQGVSACTKEIIENQKIGLIMETSYEGKLKTECWLDEPKMRRSAEGVAVLNAINEGKMVEVSTGLYYDPDPTPGMWGDEHYTGIVRNIRPDHLAILPDQKGACSIEDGAGLLRNSGKGSEIEALSFDDIRDQLRALLKSTKGPLPCDGADDDGYCWISDIFPKYAIAEKGGKVYKVGYKVRKGKVSIDEAEPEEVRKVTTYVTTNGQVFVTRNEDQQGPVKSVPKLSPSDISDPLALRQQFDSVLKTKFSGVQQEGDWGGWTTDLFANYAIFSKDGKHFRLPYTYDDDKIVFGDDAQFEEVERVSEYRRKNGTPIDGTQSPGQSTYNTGNPMTLPTIANANATKKTILITADETLAKTILTNAIHAGAHGVFHEPASAGEPHKEPAKSDTQTRTMAGGARAHEVNAMIAGGHAQEKERSYLMGLPDDHFESIKTFALKGATLPIQPYSYEGVGDRSNAVHSAAAQNVESWLRTAPPEVVAMVRNHQQQEARVRTKCIEIITNKNPKYNPAWLSQQTTEVLSGMVALAMPQQPQAPAHNYAGQGEVPMFLLNQQQPGTNGGGNGGGSDIANNVMDDDEILRLPSCG